MDTPAQAAAPPKAALAFIFAIVLLDVIALGIVIPVLPKLIEGMLGGDTPRAAEIFGLFGTAWALMQFVFSPVLGRAVRPLRPPPGAAHLHDRALGLDYILMALAPSSPGCSSAASFPASRRRASPRPTPISPTSRRRRSARAAFGMVGAAFGIGFVLGPAIGGMLGRCRSPPAVLGRGGLQPGQLRLRLFRAAGVAAAERRMAFSWARANPVGSLRLLAQHHELLGTGGRGLPLPPRPRRAAVGDRALHQLPLRLERQVMGLTLAARRASPPAWSRAS